MWTQRAIWRVFRCCMWNNIKLCAKTRSKPSHYPTCLWPRPMVRRSRSGDGWKMSLALGDITRRTDDALVISFVGPDQVLLHNGSCVDLALCSIEKNWRLSFSSAAVTVSAIHRWPDTCPWATSSMSQHYYPAMHKNAEVHIENLLNRIDLCPVTVSQSLLVQTLYYSNIWKSYKWPRILSRNETSCANNPFEVERFICCPYPQHVASNRGIVGRLNRKPILRISCHKCRMGCRKVIEIRRSCPLLGFILYKKKYTTAVRSNIFSKVIFASLVWYYDRAYYGLCVLIKDIGRRLPLQLQCSLLC